MDMISTYHSAIETVIGALGISRSLLLMHGGMAIYLGFLLALGTRRGSLAAIIATVALAILHEVMNRLFYGSWRWTDTTQDLALALFWPTACYAVSCFRRWHWAERVRQKSNDRLLHLYDYRPELPAENPA